MKKLAVHKVLINAPLETVWDKLLDWKTWNVWDKGMKSIKFDGPLELGAKGKIDLGKGLTSTLVVTDFNPQNSYESEFKLFGSRFVFDHVVESAAHCTLVTFRVSAEGTFADIFSLYMMASFGEKLPQWMDNMKRFIENKADRRIEE
ncbi:MAG TPA: SRPBCC family protein [Drouetiella sp.]